MSDPSIFAFRDYDTVWLPTDEEVDEVFIKEFHPHKILLEENYEVLLVDRVIPSDFIWTSSASDWGRIPLVVEIHPEEVEDFRLLPEQDREIIVKYWEKLLHSWKIV
ncbi:MAG: hypothetical protein ACK4NC_04895 [Candidatus Gracilibacteria bacterium]